jgi:hypothetical protein
MPDLSLELTCTRPSDEGMLCPILIGAVLSDVMLGAKRKESQRARSGNDARSTYLSENGNVEL